MDAHNAKELNYEQVKEIIEKKNPINAVFIDVRGPDEYGAGHIPSAFNVPVDVIESAFKLSDSEFQAKYNFARPAPNDAGKNIIVYCQKGMRCRKAGKILEGLGYNENLILYPNGYGEYGQK